MSKLNLNRQVLAKFLPNHEAIVAFEKVLENVGGTLPEGIEQAINQAAQSVAASNLALSTLLDLASQIEQLQTAPAAQPTVDTDDFAPATCVQDNSDDAYAPAQQFGTMAIQNAEQVEISGGVIGLDAGTVAAPSFYLVDSDTGFYRIGADNPGLAISGAKLLDFSTQLMHLVGRMRLDVGGVAAPSIYFSTDTTTGIYRPSANALAMTVSGGRVVHVDASGVQVDGVLTVSGIYVQTGAAGVGSGGQYRSVDDGGTVRWAAGLLGSVGARDYTIYDLGSGAPRLIIDASTGGVTCGTGFSCNGASPQTSAPVNPPATDLPTALSLLNQIRSALIANGICA